MTQLEPDNLFVWIPRDAKIHKRCNVPAPVVVNGATYVGCQLEAGHLEPHEIIVKWTN